MRTSKGPRLWRRFSSVRARTTILATVVVGVAVTLGTVSFDLVVGRTLVENIDDVAAEHAEDVAALASQSGLPDTLALGAGDDAVVQVVDDAGRVVAASTNVPGTVRLGDFRPRGREPVAQTVEALPIADDDDERFRVLALRRMSEEGPLTIYVATSLEPVETTMAILRGVTLVGVPVLAALVAATTWVVVGRALAPVEAIREQVADISANALEKRVHVPETADEVSRLAITMNTMLERLQAAADKQRRFIADASHELQTPLATVRTQLEVAVVHPRATEWPRTAALVLEENHLMERLVRDLLYLARADEGAPGRASTLVNLDDVVLTEVARRRGDTRVRFDTSGVSPANVLGRMNDLGRAVSNLLENAVRYASEVINVSLTHYQERVILAIQDDGPGIPLEHRRAVFERFTRLDAARSRDGGGSGLGLAIVHEIIERHGGTVTVAESSVGARLVVDLPAAPSTGDSAPS
jgi:signal transduction histidine kinase